MTIKKAVINIGMLLVCSVLQFSFSFLRPFGISADWLRCFVVCLALSESSAVISTVFALFAGLISDFSAGGFFWHRTFWFILTSYLTVALVYRLFARNIKTALAVFFVSLFLSKTVYYLLYALNSEGFSFFKEMLWGFLPTFALSLPVLCVVYLFYSKFYYGNPDIKISRRVGYRR